jgi:thiamine biosynthesis lipoprotein
MKPLPMVGAAILALVPLMVFAAGKQETLRGTCMGTKYAVTVVDSPVDLSLERLAEQVSDELERIEQIFSLYRASSELSRLNAAESGEWIGVSSDLLAVTKRALQLAEDTGGAFDPTVAPLVQLWKLRQVTSSWSPPTQKAIAKVRQRVGWRLIELREQPPALRKQATGVEMDLNALVEGWAIDSVQEILVRNQIQNALIELGGEFRSLGRRVDGQPWRIGLENPHEPGVCYATVALENAALSTSGDYRQAIEFQGRRYSHILDARTGAPIQHDLIAVSVIASDATTTDGWATALFALGPEEGFVLAEKKGLAASFVLRNGRSQPPNAKSGLRFRLTAGAMGRFVSVDNR